MRQSTQRSATVTVVGYEERAKAELLKRIRRVLREHRPPVVDPWVFDAEAEEDFELSFDGLKQPG
jgi:hypothetical protein